MKKAPKIRSLKNQLIVYSMGIIILMTILSLFSLSLMSRYRGQFDTMFQKHILLSDIQLILDEMDEDLLGFLSSKSSTRLNEYNINVQKLNNVLLEKNGDIYDMEDVMMKNIVILSKKYILKANEAVQYKRQRDVASYYESYEESGHIKGYISDYIDQLNNRQLTSNSMVYVNVVHQIKLLQTITICIVILLILLSLVIVYLITARMARPFASLSQAAEAISKGDFDTEDVVVDTEDELQLLANTFNRMKNSIKTYIDEMKKNAEIESRLKDEKLKNMKMEHLLDNARLYALQSQINPHFLFNTINAGVQMSIMERAPRTGQFLESMSSLFRYNIQEMDSTCTLEQEIQNIKDYYDLLRVRFGKRILFEFNIDDTTLDTWVPPLILQPLVENAYIHGLSGLEEGGTITLTTMNHGDYTTVTIEDNGKGINQETINKILEDQAKEKGKGTGIGVRNVRDRLELFYHKPDTFKMEGEEDKGVKITLKLYREVEGNDHV